VRKRNKEEGGRRKSTIRSWTINLVVPSSLLLVPFLCACKPKPADTRSTADKLKALETKTEKAFDVAKEKSETLVERFARERVIFSARFNEQLKRTEARLVELKRRAELNAERRPVIERGIRVLEARTRTLRERMERLKAATAEQWDQMKEPWQKKEGYEDYEDQILKETSM
jgi:hypothetical protein